MDGRADGPATTTAATRGARPSTPPQQGDASAAAPVVRLPLLMPGLALRLTKDAALLHALARFTCMRCRCVLRNRTRYLLHVVQCRMVPEEHRARSVWVLAADPCFVRTRWPKGTPLAGLLKAVGWKVARREGYASIAAWLRDVVYRPCFQAAVAAARTPTMHRPGTRWLRDATGRRAWIAPVDLSPAEFAWWCSKEVQGRAAPILHDLLDPEADTDAHPWCDDTADPTSIADAARANAAAEDRAAAARRDLYRLVGPEAVATLSAREQRLLRCLRDGSSTAEIRAALGIQSDQAVYAATHRLRRKLATQAR